MVIIRQCTAGPAHKKHYTVQQLGVHCVSYYCKYAGIPRFKLLMWGLKNITLKQNPRKWRSLSSTKGEENRLESSTEVNQNLRKSKPRKSRNACTKLYSKILQWQISIFPAIFKSMNIKNSHLVSLESYKNSAKTNRSALT